MWILLVALLIVWPIAEIYVMVLVSQSIGFFWMLALIFASAVSGMLVLRHRGRAHWQRFRGAVDERRPPTREAFDGAMITAGAALLIIPGFISSTLGLLLLFPPTRALVRIAAFALFAGRFTVVTTSAGWGAGQYGKYRSGRREFDLEGEAVDVTGRPDDDEDSPQLPPADRPGER
ncbi:MAG: FxsA family protein [Thermoleophilia bacterium]|nr:FxsA family protein [Thermoleophilia bacterium]